MPGRRRTLCLYVVVQRLRPGLDRLCNGRIISNPQTAYATCKTLVERDLQPMADDHFSPIFLRNATAYGASPRMRFDIVLNNLAGLAWTTQEIEMVSDVRLGVRSFMRSISLRRFPVFSTPRARWFTMKSSTSVTRHITIQSGKSRRLLPRYSLIVS